MREVVPGELVGRRIIGSHQGRFRALGPAVRLSRVMIGLDYGCRGATAAPG
jgi:hypothetical protein